jgi:hypothetical protein
MPQAEFKPAIPASKTFTLGLLAHIPALKLFKQGLLSLQDVNPVSHPSTTKREISCYIRAERKFCFNISLIFITGPKPPNILRAGACTHAHTPTLERALKTRMFSNRLSFIFRFVSVGFHKDSESATVHCFE